MSGPLTAAAAAARIAIGNGRIAADSGLLFCLGLPLGLSRLLRLLLGLLLRLLLYSGLVRRFLRLSSLLPGRIVRVRQRCKD